jgi:hypothetical protein
MRIVGAIGGLLAGVLGAVAMTGAAVVAPLLGLAAVLLTPVRALVSRLRHRAGHRPGGPGPGT